MPFQYGIQIPKLLGQTALRLVHQFKLIDKRYDIKRSDNTLIIPLIRQPTKEEIHWCQNILSNTKIIVDEFSQKKQQIRSINEILKDTLPPELLKRVPRSMDVIGDVAIIKIPWALEEWKSQIGNAILYVNKHVKTVLAKAGKIHGPYRLHNIEILAGASDTSTIHKEYGCTYHLDPQKVFFSPRLSEERIRVASQVKQGEVIVDMFSSIGSFAIQIAKQQKADQVYAIDLNTYAINFLKTNIHLNHMEDIITPIMGDARAFAKEYGHIADRIIMDLPEQSWNFIEAACQILKVKGGILHFYCFASESCLFEKVIKQLQQRIVKENRAIKEILVFKTLRSVAPQRWHIVVDAHVI